MENLLQMGYKYFPFPFFEILLILLAFDLHLLHINSISLLIIIDTTLHSHHAEVINRFSLFFVKYSPYQKMFQTEVVQLKETYRPNPRSLQTADILLRHGRSICLKLRECSRRAGCWQLGALNTVHVLRIFNLRTSVWACISGDHYSEQIEGNKGLKVEKKMDRKEINLMLVLCGFVGVKSGRNMTITHLYVVSNFKNT